ncbi:MAG: hypothetical protein KGI92_10765 [Alphaproteobacteria bacterium]|nr:hypothetical protein [Alphaproteobacteria bacterium]
MHLCPRCQKSIPVR